MRSRRSDHTARSNHQRRRRAHQVGAIALPEQLEPRLALATDLSVELVDDVLRIEGTDGEDAIFVRRFSGGVFVDYSSGNNVVGHRSFPTGVGKLEVRGGGGRDMIVLRVGVLTDKTVVDAGPGADLVVSRVPVDVRDALGRDMLALIVDRSLPAGAAVTTRRTEKSHLVHKAVYTGQSLVAASTWLADGRSVEVSFDGQGGTVRDTFLGSRLVLSESWDSNGGYQRTVTDVDGTRLRETFEKGTLQIEEREQDGRSATTLFGANGEAIRHSVAGGKMQAEEVWDGAGGYRRTWVNDAGAVTKEVFENGKPGIKTISNGRHVERSGADAAGNRVREVFIDDVLTRRDQWDTAGGQLITRFEAGVLASRETFQGTQRVQLEEWAGGQLVRTAWNASGDRLVQTLVGDTKITEQESRASGERRLTEWAGGQTIRTTSDSAGNVSVEKLAGERLLSRELRSVDGSLQRTTFDPATGQPVTEERAAADGRQSQLTIWSPADVVRTSRRDGAVVLQEQWRDGGLTRTSDDGAGTVRVEEFRDSDRETLAEGTKASEVITTPGGERLETEWIHGGYWRECTKDGVIVFAEQLDGGFLTKIVYGTDGSGQQEVFESGRRIAVSQWTANQTFRTQQFTSSGLPTYEYIQDELGTFRETNWSWGLDEFVTTVFGEGPGVNGSRNNRLRTETGPGYQTRQLWQGSASIPGSGMTYLEESDYTENRWGGPLGPTDTKRETRFFDAGRLVYHQRIKGNGATELPTNRPSAAWDQARQGSYFNLSDANVFSLVPGGGSLNFVALGGYLEERRKAASGARDEFFAGIEANFKPLEQTISNANVIFSGIQGISRALDVNFRTIQGDLAKVLGAIDFGKLSLPNLDVRFNDIGFGKVFDQKFQLPEVKFTNPFASIDFSPLAEPRLWSELAFGILNNNPITNGMKWLGDRFMTASDWLADRDPFTWAGRRLGVDWGPSGERKVVLVAPGERFLEAGYTRDQAALLHDLMDRTPQGLRGRYLDEFNIFLAEEGQRVYQAHLLADGGELDAAGHAALQQVASVAAQARLLARYGLNPDGSRIPPGANDPGLGLGDIPLPAVTIPDERDPRFSTGAESTWWEFDPDPIQPSAPQKKTDPERKKPKQKDDPEAERKRQDEERARATEQQRQRQARVEATRRKVRDEFPAALQKSVVENRNLYAQAKGKQVKDFHDSVEQTLRIGGAFAAGLGAGATAAVEGLAKTVVAVLDADTWRGLAATVRTQGRNFMKAEDKAKFIADFGQQAYTSLENSVIATVDEWERASPEGRARMLGALAGQIATEAVLPGVLTKVAGNIIPLPGHPPIVLGRKAQHAVDRIAESNEFPAYAKRVKDAAGPNKKDLNSLLEGHRKSTGQSLAEQLRKQCGMDPEHVRRLSEYAKQNNFSIVVRSANPNSLQWHGKKGFAAKPGNLALKTNPKTGLVTATRRADGALVDALGKVVDDCRVGSNGWIEKVVDGRTVRTNYRLSSTGHVVDAKGTKFFSDYDILCVDKSPVAGTGWTGVPTGTKGTGPRAVIDEMNEAIVGSNRSRDMFKHGANRENLVKDANGIYQVDTPDIGDTFAVIDPDGSIFVGDRLYVRRLLEGRDIPTNFVLPPQTNPSPVPNEF
jgi:hypothetical protein